MPTLPALPIPEETFPPPPPDAREFAAVVCQGCGDVLTRHRTAECVRCGRWAAQVDAAEIAPGDLVWYGLWWWTVQTVTRRTVAVVEIALRDGPTITHHPLAGITVATHHRRNRP